MSMLKKPGINEDIGKLIRDRKHQDGATYCISSDLEKELNIYRSGSASPTVEGSLNSVGGLLNGLTQHNVNYYYSNGNLNPRLPPPLLSREDWRFSQSLQGGNGNNGSSGNRSLFAVKPWFGGEEEENCAGRGARWGGLPGFGDLDSRQSRVSEIFQDDMNHEMEISSHPSRPSSRNAFDDGIETSETQFANLHHDLRSVDTLLSSVNKIGMPLIQKVGSSASHTYAFSLGVSLPRSITPDLHHAASAPSPRIASISSSMGKRSVTGPNTLNGVGSNSFNGVSVSVGESAELVAALSGLNLSTNGAVDEENHSQSETDLGLDHHHIKQNSYLNKFEPEQCQSHSTAHSAKGPCLNMSKSIGKGMDLKKSSLLADGQGRSTPTVNGAASPPILQSVDNMNFMFPNYSVSGFPLNPSSPPMLGNRLGSGTLPPSFENATAPSATGGTGLESRALAVGMALNPNLIAAVAELQNFSGLGNHNAGNALQAPLLDPLYLQYLRSNELAAAQVAALNDSMIDREYGGNSYLDSLGLQKAYLGALQESYYGNPALSLGMSYPGSPFVGALFLNSPVGSGSPV
ncbi:hypothetical protein DITRI_Ditri02bG0138400 [Diplodiscus trichospermus]